MCQAPARQTGLSRKGRIEVGCDADFCVFAPDDTFVVDAARLHHKNAVTPYDGRLLDGVVRSTFLRGERIDIHAEPRGRLLTSSRNDPGRAQLTGHSRTVRQRRWTTETTEVGEGS
jgi:allantoinase